MKDSDTFGFASIGFGIAGFFWETAVFGLVLSFIGLVAGRSAFTESNGSGLSIAGIVISGIAAFVNLAYL